MRRTSSRSRIQSATFVEIPMADMRGYSAGKFMLELEGKNAGFLHSVEGGEPVASVISEPLVAANVADKHLGTLSYDPIRMTFGTAMDESFYQWIAAWL